MQGFAFTKLKNLTPHPLNFFDHRNNVYLVLDPDPCGSARCDMQRNTVGEAVVSDAVSVPINQVAYGEVHNMPDPAPNTMYVVSLPVAQALRGIRTDVMLVDELVRDGTGRIIGARALSQLNDAGPQALYTVVEIQRQQVSSPSVWTGRERDGRHVAIICCGNGNIEVYVADVGGESIYETAPVLTLQVDGMAGYLSYPDLRRLLAGQVALPLRFTSQGR